MTPEVRRGRGPLAARIARRSVAVAWGAVAVPAAVTVAFLPALTTSVAATVGGLSRSGVVGRGLVGVHVRNRLGLHGFVG